MVWDEDVALPATGKAGCCLNMLFPVAILISEMQNFKIKHVKAGKEGSGMFEVLQ